LRRAEDWYFCIGNEDAVVDEGKVDGLALAEAVSDGCGVLRGCLPPNRASLMKVKFDKILNDETLLSVSNTPRQPTNIIGLKFNGPSKSCSPGVSTWKLG
jgi:hypothetical protein